MEGILKGTQRVHRARYERIHIFVGHHDPDLYPSLAVAPRFTPSQHVAAVQGDLGLGRDREPVDRAGEHQGLRDPQCGVDVLHIIPHDAIDLHLRKKKTGGKFLLYQYDLSWLLESSWFSAHSRCQLLQEIRYLRLRSERALMFALAEMYAHGVSTRIAAAITERMYGTAISSTVQVFLTLV